MLFNSIEFVLFFPVVVLGYFLMPAKCQSIWLLLASYFFYMSWNPKYALLMLFSTTVTWLCGRILQSIKERQTDADVCRRRMKWCVAAGAALNLAVLFYFKYFNFAIENVNRVLSSAHVDRQFATYDIVLPVGISFFTFQALGYTIDVYRGETEAEKNFLKYALFVSFFPQLVAGPIERSKNLLRQVRETHRFDYENLRDGVYLMLWGYFLKMVLADRIALFVDTVYGNMRTYTGVYLAFATFLFAFQIYCDFAGYSTIAMGAAKIMGFELMENFRAPYFGESVAGFWQRWHISLSSWFRDYLYIPLGGNRKGTLRKYLNILIVFSVSGLWHGAGWTFVIWGLLNAVYQIIGGMTRKVRERAADVFCLHTDSFGHRLAQIIVTFVLVDFSWIFFRSGSVDQAVQVIQSILHHSNLWILFDESLSCKVITRKNFVVMIVGLLILAAADFLKYRGVCVREFIKKQDFWFRYLVVVGSVVLILIFGIWGPEYDEAGFIYFQF